MTNKIKKNGIQKSREEYAKRKIRFFTEENCPFCTELNKKEILFSSKFWIIAYNKYPYFWDKKGLLSFPKRHIKLTVELNREELADFIEVEKFMLSFYDQEDYFSFIRQTKSNKSVEHIHYHYLPWTPSAKEIEWENYFKIKK